MSGVVTTTGTVSTATLTGADVIAALGWTPLPTVSGTITSGGTIQLVQFGGNTITLAGTVSTGGGGTLTPAGTATLGGVLANAGTTGQYVSGINTSTGALIYGTPAGGGTLTPAGTATLGGLYALPASGQAVLTGLATTGTLSSSTIDHTWLSDWTSATSGFLTSQQWTAGSVSALSGLVVSAGTLSTASSAINNTISEMVFGFGADGAVTINSGTTTLSRDMFYSTLVLSGGTLIANGYSIRCSVSATFSGGVLIGLPAAQRNGGSASGSTNGSGVTGTPTGSYYTLPPSVAGGNGAIQYNASAASGYIGSTGNSGLIGGAGGAGGRSGASTIGTGGAGGTITLQPVLGVLQPPPWAAQQFGVAAITAGASGGGGGGGTGDGVGGHYGGPGGAGGAGGGAVYLAAPTIYVSGAPASSVQAIGGAGGNGGNAFGTAPTSGGGGGGGGGGGLIVLAYQAVSGSATNILDVSGGAGGTGGNAYSGSYGGGYGGPGGNSGAIWAYDLNNNMLLQAVSNIAPASSPATPSGATGTAGAAGGVGKVSLPLYIMTLSAPATAYVAAGSSTAAIVPTVALINYAAAPTLDVSANGGTNWTTFANGNTLTGGGVLSGVSVGTASASGTIALAGGTDTLKFRDHNATSVVTNTSTLVIASATISNGATSAMQGVSFTAGTIAVAGITTAYAGLMNSGTADGSRVAVTNGGTASFAPTMTGTETLNVWDASTGGNLLAQGGTITIPVPSATVTNTPTAATQGTAFNAGTVTLSSIVTAYAGLYNSGTLDGSSRTAVTTGGTVSLAPSLYGAETLNVYSASTGGTLIGQSGTITVAQAAIMIVANYSGEPSGATTGGSGSVLVNTAWGAGSPTSMTFSINSGSTFPYTLTKSGGDHNVGGSSGNSTWTSSSVSIADGTYPCVVKMNTGATSLVFNIVFYNPSDN